MMMSGSARRREARSSQHMLCGGISASCFALHYQESAGSFFLLQVSKQAIDQAHETQSGFGTVHQISKQTTRKRTTRQKDERTARAIPDFACHNNNNFLTSTVGLPLKSFLFTIVLFFYFLFYRPRRFGFHTCRLHRIPPLIALFSKQLFPFYHFVIYLV
jgi:hypothetical protein